MSTDLSVGSIIELNIDKLSYHGGRGVGRHFNFVFFVTGTAPGDKIKAEVTSLKKNFGEAQCLEIIKSSPSRVKPPCPVFGQCGGCTWQHINYQEQLRQKKEILEFNLRHYWSQDISLFPSPKEMNYRNRIQVHQQGTDVGYYRRGSHQLISIDECLIADSKINLELLKLKTQPTPTKKRFEIALTQGGEIICEEEQGKNPHHFFSQVNTEMNELLVQKVVQDTLSQDPDKIFDLYAGDGNFSFPLHQKTYAPIEAVELSHSSIAAATARIQKEGLQGIEFIQDKVESYLKKLSHIPQSSLFILDPPRQGCHPLVIQQILRLKPKYLLYISCNLPMLTRDLKKLHNNYILADLYALDMFPQTEQMETVCLLELKSS